MQAGNSERRSCLPIRQPLDVVEKPWLTVSKQIGSRDLPHLMWQPPGTSRGVSGLPGLGVSAHPRPAQLAYMLTKGSSAEKRLQEQ